MDTAPETIWIVPHDGEMHGIWYAAVFGPDGFVEYRRADLCQARIEELEGLYEQRLESESILADIVELRRDERDAAIAQLATKDAEIADLQARCNRAMAAHTVSCKVAIIGGSECICDARTPEQQEADRRHRDRFEQ